MKTTSTATPLHEPTEAEIQHTAFRLWMEGGCRDGVELDNWFAARELLRHHHGRPSGHANRHGAMAPVHALTVGE